MEQSLDNLIRLSCRFLPNRVQQNGKLPIRRFFDFLTVAAITFFTVAAPFRAHAAFPFPPNKVTLKSNVASPTANLSLVKTVSDNTPDSAQIITYTIVVSNAGPDAATDAEVTDVVPAGLQYIVGSQMGSGTHVNSAPSTTGLKWQHLLIPSSGSVTLSFQARVTASRNTVVVNFAQVTASVELDPNSTPNNGNIGEDDGDTESITVNNPGPPPVVLTCPTTTTTGACQTQAAVNAAFSAWLATASGSGGCSGVLTNNNGGAPSACGGSTTVTFTYTSSCAPLTTTCQATFTVSASPTVVLTCPTTTTTGACQTQAAVNSAFATWLATASASGGCNGVLTNNNTGAPSACGGSTTVTFTYTSSCIPTTTTCQATFTVSAASTPVLTCPTNLVRPGCSTRQQDSIAMENWFNTRTFSGGCGGVLSLNGFNGSPPDRCGGVKTLNLTYTTNCAAPLTCSATFTIPAPPTVVLTCPVNNTQPSGQTQTAINSAFATWLATASASGGCSGVLSNNNTGAPLASGGTTTVTFTYTSTCAPLTTTCQATFTVSPPTPPSNDLCGDATVLTPAPDMTCNPVAGTTVNALQSIPAITCETFTATSALDVWYQFTATATSHNVVVDGGTNFDAVVDIRSGTCDGVNIACSDVTVSGGIETAQLMGLTIGQTYLVRVYDFTGTGTFDICVTTPVPPVVLTCPTNTTTTACQTQAAVNTAFATWLATASGTGGCNGVLTNNNTGAPSACGGSTTVTFTYTSTCAPLTTTCQATFTVPASPTVVLTCPTNTTTTACQTQAAVNTAFATWLATASGSGGCSGALTNNNTGAPSACGGSTTVTFTYTSTCAPTTTTCQATFTVPASPTVVLTCPTNTTTTACQTQAAVNSAFATWLATASGSGGCSGVLTNNNTGAPSACGGSTTVTFTYTSTCAPLTTTCQATFTVPASPTVVLTCPTTTTTTACQTQAAVNSAFATWLATASASGGCSGVLTNNNTGAPSACGGSTTVTFTYTSTCAPLTTTCQATFTVPAPPTVVLTCPTNTTTTACQTQAAVNTAFATWLATASASGGCSGALTNNNTGAPSACGGSTTVTFTYTSTCAPLTTTCQATFTVPAPSPVVLNCPVNTTTTACQTQAAVNTAFATWLATASASGGCSGALTNNNTGAPSACGGSTTVTFTYTSSCAPTTTTCQATFTVPAPPTVVLTCPANTTTTACQTQATVNAAFATWLATASASGGCGGILTNDNSGAPPACGGVTTVTFTYVSSCAPLVTSCQATFTVPVTPVVTLTCPTPATVGSCLTQADVTTQYNAWLNSATASGGCAGILTNDSPGAPSNCSATGSTTTVTFTFTNGCSVPVTCTSTFTVQPYGDFTVPANGAATVACPSAITQPTPSPVTDACGNTLTPTGPVITNAPNPLTCEGTRTYAWTYTDCAGHTHTWSFVYTLERLDFTVPANGASTIACLASATQPTPPTVLSNCGETITPTGPVITDAPNPLTCEGTRTYAWTYTDCEGNTHTWSFVYTVERLDFTVPANGASTVACPALATQPTPPTVLSNCGETITPTGPVITNAPNPLACEGTRTYAWTYTDCEGNTHPWSFVYTIERLPFTVPANGTATVACPALATQPAPPTVLSNCGETITPTGPTITNVPNPMTCEGTRTYAWVYTDCEGNTATWSFVYTIERQPFGISVPTGTALVDCPDDSDVVPTPPTVVSACGETLTPVLFNVTQKPGCGGQRNYTFRYTDCEGNTADWLFIYNVQYLDFVVPPNETETVECPINAIQPTPPVVFDNCNNLVNPTGPVITNTSIPGGCETSRTYAWTYNDCDGNIHVWSKTYLFDLTANFFPPLDEEHTVSCLLYAQAPIPQTLFDICGRVITVTGPTMEENIDASGCSGTRVFHFVYTDCAGNSYPWKFTYFANDNLPPVGTCPSSSNNVDNTHLSCIEDVPCPDDYDFSSKVQELIAAGGIYDICSGDNLNVELDSWSALWECSDPDGDGVFTFGRTFYFSIADACGNQMPDLCSVTYSGSCQPLQTFTQADWGIAGGDPGADVSIDSTDLEIITELLTQGGPIVIGGINRSLTVTDPLCVPNLLPGISASGALRPCHQVNCTGCNPMSVGGLKNSLAANTIALILNMRFNVTYNELSMANIRNQRLNCFPINAEIVNCSNTQGNCTFVVQETNGTIHSFPYTLGGLLDLANLYLNGNLVLSIGQSALYATAINAAIQDANAYWQEPTPTTVVTCDPTAGVNDINDEPELPNANRKSESVAVQYSLSPNPANREMEFKLVKLVESQPVTFEVYSALGNKLLQRDYGTVTYVKDVVDLSSLGGGMYIVVVKAGDKRSVQKLFVVKD